VSGVTAKLVNVDGNNNVVIDISESAFVAVGVVPSEYELLKQTGSTTAYRVKVGAGGSRYLGDVHGLGEDARKWPDDLPSELAQMIAAAVPNADSRIRLMRAAGKRVPAAVYSNDLARVRGEQPEVVAARYRATALSIPEYEALAQEIKNAAEPIPEKAFRLAQLVLDAIPPPSELGAKASMVPGPMETTVTDLTTTAQRFVRTAQELARHLHGQTGFDWSGPVMGICAAFEVESIQRLIEPLGVELRAGPIPDDDVEDKDIGRITKYCVGLAERPPEIGTIGRFLQLVGTSKRRMATSPTLQAFKSLLAGWRGGDWLIDRAGGVAAFDELTRLFRNRAAHTDEITETDFEECRQFVTGSDGILWKLVRATGSATNRS
jgi:hypothetical protein